MTEREKNIPSKNSSHKDITTGNLNVSKSPGTAHDIVDADGPHKGTDFVNDDVRGIKEKPSTFEQIKDFVTAYPRVWEDDQRLHALKHAETLRNAAEAYLQINKSKIPTNSEIAEFRELVKWQLMADLTENIGQTNTQGFLLKNGKFHKVSQTDDGEIYKKLIFSAPLQITGITDRDGDYLIKYSWLDTADSRPADEFLTFINSTLKLSGTARQAFAEFLYALIGQAKEKGMIVDDPTPISVSRDGVIGVNFDVQNMNTSAILSAIRGFHPRSTNPRAFLSALSYATTAPLHYHIRKYSPPQFLTPLHVSNGITGSGKTTTCAIFVLNGYAQRKQEGVLGLEQVRTAFTLAHNLGDSTLPVIINDVNTEWLDRLSEQLKNISESSIASDRGRPDQTINRREVKRSIFITMNQEIALGDDAARARRNILESYTKENLAKQDFQAYNAFTDSLPDGFMFGIFKEIYQGKNVLDVVKEVRNITSSSGFVNYGIGKINELCGKYNVDPFPLYNSDQVETAGGPAGMLCEWFIDQWNRLNTLDASGRVYAPYPEVSATELHIREDKGIHTIYFTGAAYKAAKNRLGFKFNSATDLLNNIVNDPIVKVVFSLKNHKFQGTSLKAFCLEYKGGGSDE
jgi:hypothetical protein